MILYLVVTRDVVANVHSNLMQVPHIGGSIRAFGDECKRKEPNNILAQHPEDFELWIVGEYDDNTGIITPYNHPERKQLAVGANYRE